MTDGAASLEDLARSFQAILIDSNALIYHLDSAADQDALTDATRSLAERRALVQPAAPAIVAFYDWWCASLTAAPRCYVTDAVLDLELSGWRFIGRDPERYRKRLRCSRVPRGDLIKDWDGRPVKRAKNRLLQLLDRERRINKLLKSSARGIRGVIGDLLLERPIWRGAGRELGLSLVDRNLAINALAAASLGRTALITNDRALRDFLKSLRAYLRDASWARGSAAERAAQRLSAAELKLVGWERREPAALVFAPGTR